MKMNIETKILFPVVRIIGLVFAVSLLITIIGAVIFFFTLDNQQIMKKHVSYLDIEKSLNSNDQDSVEIVGEGLYFSENVKESFTGENLEILYGWLDSYDSDDEKQDFLNNLNVVIKAGKKNNNEDDVMNDYINEYKVLKFEKDEKDKKDIFGFDQYIITLQKVMKGPGMESRTFFNI